MIAQGYKDLSHRERQVLQAVWDGLRVKEIGGRLRIASRTVEYHKAVILRKWHCRNFLTVCRLALKRRYLKI
ncbi:MAG: helix-turn-helix transcriptional regulator [Nitrospira sp.]